MAPEETQEQGLISELRAIDSFRRRYAEEQPAARLDAQDPDVQRMIEVLAFSAVRTRQALQRSVRQTWRRLLGGYFQPLLCPLPAMSMLEVQVTARMTETTVLPAGTEVQVQMADGFVAGFQTLAELRITPMTLERCETLRAPQGLRLVLSFVSRLPRSESVGLLRLYLHYLDDYLAALTVHQQLQRYLRRAFVVYDSAVQENSDGPACTVHFGTRFEEPYEADERNPLSAVRDFFHYPEQELMLHIAVPPAQRPWNRLSICLDLDGKWPRRPAIFREMFRPFTVPVRNLRRASAQPILCDGTQDGYPIRHVHAAERYQLHTVDGVFRITGEGLMPIPLATLNDTTSGYEVESMPRPNDEAEEVSSLILRLPHAVVAPVQVVVEAQWYQPSLNQHLTGPTQLSLLSRSAQGMELGLVGAIRRGLWPGLGRDADALLRLMALKMKSVLDREEICGLFALLEALNRDGTNPYRDFPARITQVTVEVAPDETLRGAGIRHRYHLLVPLLRPEEEPLWDSFCQQLTLLLDAWDYEGRAEVVRHSDPAELPKAAATATAPGRLRNR